jgi:uncharacterized membrane protein
MKKTVIQPHKSSLGIDANIIALVIFVVMAIVWWIPYLRYLAWCVPAVIFFIEKESKFVKFQACTAIAIGILRAAIEIIMEILIRIITPTMPSLSSLNVLTFRADMASALRRLDIALFLYEASIIIGIVLTVGIAVLGVMALLYKQIKLPLIGFIAEKLSSKLSNVNLNININTQNNTNTDTAANNPPDNTSGSAAKPIFCGECGAKNEAGTKFCGGCGNPLS